MHAWPRRAAFFAVPLALLAVALSTDAGPAGKPEPAKDWPLFRGNPTQTGVATGALPAELAVLWKFQAKDSFEATVAIAGGTVYAGCYDEHLYALRLADGKLLWKEKVGPIKSPVSVYKDAVYVGTEDGLFFCLDAAKGTKRWSFETNAEITGGANFAGDKVIFGSYDSHLYCVNTAGKGQWAFDTKGPVNGSPAVAGKYTFVAGCDSHLHVVEIDTGKDTLSVDLEGQAGSTPAVIGDELYVGTMTNQVKAVDWKKGEVRWSYEPDRPSPGFFASAAVTDALVVVGSRDRRAYALDRKTGKKVWTFATGGKVDGSPVIVGKRVYVPSLDGSLYVLDLASGTQVQKLELGRGIAASPAVAEGRLVIGTVDTPGVLYCLGAKK
jgi:outer membrane protein assembly factor BamB